MEIWLKNYEDRIIVSPETFFEIQNGQVMCARDLCYKFPKGEWPKLRTVYGNL